MARPVKQGLDYFPLDTNLDNKLELFEAEFGLQGFGFIIKIYQQIYNNGYFYEWNQDEQLLFAKKINVDNNSINVYINSAIKRGLFDKNLFDKYKILTSRGVQKRYLEACKRRKQIEIIKEYFLININSPEYKEFLHKIVFVHNNLINVNINDNYCIHNVDNNSQNDDNNSQIKVNKSKVNNNIITTTNNKNNICDIDVDINYSEEQKNSVVVDTISDKVLDFYNKHIDKITDYTCLFIQQCRDKKIPDELIIYAMEQAVEKNKKTIAYIRGTLENWEKENITSVLEAQQIREKFKLKAKNKACNKQKNYDNYTRRQYDNLNDFYTNNDEIDKEKAKGEFV